MSVFNSKKAMDRCSTHKTWGFCQGNLLKWNTALESICSEQAEYLTKPSLILLHFLKAIEVTALFNKGKKSHLDHSKAIIWNSTDQVNKLYVSHLAYNEPSKLKKAGHANRNPRDHPRALLCSFMPYIARWSSSPASKKKKKKKSVGL